MLLVIILVGVLINIGWLIIVGHGTLVAKEWHDVVDYVQKPGYGNAVLLVSVAVIVVWGMMGLGASLAFTGRPKLVSALFISPTIITVPLPWVLMYGVLPQTLVWAILHGILWAIGIAGLAGTLWAFCAARCRRLITVPKIWLAVGLWVAMCVVVGYVVWSGNSRPVETSKFGLRSIVLVMGLLAMIVAPLACAPLALAWNRHR